LLGHCHFIVICIVICIVTATLLLLLASTCATRYLRVGRVPGRPRRRGQPVYPAGARHHSPSWRWHVQRLVGVAISQVRVRDGACFARGRHSPSQAAFARRRRRCIRSARVVASTAGAPGLSRGSGWGLRALAAPATRKCHLSGGTLQQWCGGRRDTARALRRALAFASRAVCFANAAGGVAECTRAARILNMQRTRHKSRASISSHLHCSRAWRRPSSMSCIFRSPSVSASSLTALAEPSLPHATISVTALAPQISPVMKGGRKNGLNI